MKGRIPWIRILAESVAIVASILIAFALDAWWDARTERISAEGELERVLDDIRSTLQELDFLILRQEAVASSIGALHQIVDHLAPGTQVLVADTLLAALINHPTLDPTTVSIERLVNSGAVFLVGDEEIQGLITRWFREWDNVRENEQLQRLEVNDHVVRFMVEHDMDIGKAFQLRSDWHYERVDSEAARGQTEIRVWNGLKTLLGERLVEARALLRKYGDFREFNLQLSERLEEILR